MNALKTLCLLLVLVSSSSIFAQKETLVKKPGFFCTKFYHGDTQINKDEMFQLFEKANQPELINMYKHGHNSFQIGEFLGGIGGWLLGDQLGRFVTNKETSQKTIAVGFAITGLSLALSIPGARKMKKALRIYNEESKDSKFTINTKLTSNGLAFVFNF